MTEILKAIFFGIVEGITEWLPISSTGHMILLDEFIKLEVSESFLNMFLIVIQLGAILAVVFIFWGEIWPFALKGRKDKKENDWQLGLLLVKRDIIVMWLKIAAACVPVIAFKLLGLDEICDRYFYNPVGVAVALIVFGVAFIIVEDRNKSLKAKADTVAEITWQLALVIGLFQLLAAAFPGTSRSGATIIGALIVGVSRVAASEFTFILAIPVMFGAGLVELLEFGFDFGGSELGILAAGLVTAFVVSVFVIKFLLGYIRRHDFKVFGIYRIVLGLIVLIYFALR